MPQSTRTPIIIQGKNFLIDSIAILFFSGQRYELRRDMKQPAGRRDIIFKNKLYIYAMKTVANNKNKKGKPKGKFSPGNDPLGLERFFQKKCFQTFGCHRQ